MQKRKKQTTNPMLRIRVDVRFKREIDEYISAVNQTKTANYLDCSHLVREAVVEFLGKRKAQLA